MRETKVLLTSSRHQRKIAFPQIQKSQYILVTSSYVYTVKLGNKELFDKEQIGIKIYCLIQRAT